MSDGPARRRELLDRVPLFVRLEPAQLDALAAVTTTRRLAAREELFHKGDPAAQVYVVASGQLKVVTTSKEGDDVVFNLLGEGEVVGELPLLTGGRRTGTVSALEPSELLVLERRDFLRFLRERPEAASALLVVLAERLVRISEFVEDTLFLNLPARLAKKLLYLAERYGEEGPAGVQLQLRLSQGELADLVGSSRESINKQIRAWTDERVVRMERGAITIQDRAALERLAGLLAS
jgi:CRP-like cAMP-binding protein